MHHVINVGFRKIPARAVFFRLIFLKFDIESFKITQRPLQEKCAGNQYFRVEQQPNGEMTWKHLVTEIRVKSVTLGMDQHVSHVMNQSQTADPNPWEWATTHT